MNATAAAANSIVLGCPQCHGIARIPSDRLDANPKCPRCKSLLLSGKPVNLNSDTFSAHVGRGTWPIVVDFWADWCGPCKMMAPVLDKLAIQRAARLQVGKVDTEAQPELAGRFNIRSIPTLILFKEGRELARQSGAVDLSALTRWLDTTLSA